MSQAEEFLNIDTPENVVFGYEIAGIGSRFMAAFVDTILFVMLQAIVFIVMNAAFDLASGTVAAAVLAALGFIFSWGYYVFFEMAWNGQSPGKRWAGLRVIRRDGSPITLTESIIRNLIRPIDFLPVAYAVGVITMFFNRQANRLGDLAAGTLVVYAQEEVSLSSLKEMNRGISVLRNMVSDEMMQWPVNRLTNQDVELAQDYLRRRIELKNPALAQTIRRALFSRMGMEPDAVGGHDDDMVIMAIVDVWQLRQQGG